MVLWALALVIAACAAGFVAVLHAITTAIGV